VARIKEITAGKGVMSLSDCHRGCGNDSDPCSTSKPQSQGRGDDVVQIRN